jgi:hypothetical protein
MLALVTKPMADLESNASNGGILVRSVYRTVEVGTETGARPLCSTV